MTKYISSNGNEGVFDSSKIRKSVSKAMKTGSGVFYPRIANIIAEEAEEKFSKKEVVYSKEVDKFVLKRLFDYGQDLTANAYERYKTTKHFQKQDGIIDKDIIGIIDGSNEKAISENANKDARMSSTQRDLIAGAESRSYAARKLLPTHILNAHNEGIIHIHDMDYMIQPMFNCFDSETKFITDKGVFKFSDFKDGDEVIVPTHKGNWKKAKVRCYGRNKLYQYTISTINREKYGIDIIATENHRWFDENGNEQIGLYVGDKLLTKNYLYEDINTVLENAQIELLKSWCIGFAIGDGYTQYNKTKNSITPYTKIRLCGDKNKYINIFNRCGFNSCQVKDQNKDNTVWIGGFDKNKFLEKKLYANLSRNEIKFLMYGLLCADGDRNKNGFSSISSSNPYIGKMIEKYMDLTGYFVTSKFEKNNITNYGKRTNPLTTFVLQTYLPSVYSRKDGKVVIKPHTLKVIKKEYVKEELTWCLEVEDDKSFVLAGGIITGNCQLINLKDMFENGTVINGKMIETPKSFKTACTVATQISLQVANGQYGGQTFSVSHLAPFVRVSYNKYINQLKENFKEIDIVATDEQIEKEAMKLVRQEIKDGVQTIQFQENTFSSNNGQTPFVSIFMYLNEEPEYVKETAMIIEEMLNLRYLGMKNEYGVYVTPSFPKLLYVLDENNVPKDSEYRYLTDLAVKCSAKRMNPDYISAKIMRQQFDNEVFPCMGCRSFLSPWKDENNKYKWYGRFNRGVVTINLVDVALSSGGDEEKFWGILDERLELCKEAMLIKDRLLRGASANVSPIHWRYGSVARLGENDTIDKYLDGGYSSISLGYIGCYEMCKVMTGESNTSEVGAEFQARVMKHLEDKTIEWRNIDGLNGASLYGTPSESLTYKFAQKTRNRFGEICGITDKDWFTNSYHINVCEECNAFDKLSFESQYQRMSKGGAVSYVEIPDMNHNLEALSEIIEHMYNTIQYAEVNTTGGDYCAACGYEGELQIDEQSNWYCPQCGNRDKNKMSACRRVCGYLNASMDINKGKMSEFKHRVKHI